jgi:hypothetical protein
VKTGILAGAGMLVAGALLAYWCNSQLGQFEGLAGEMRVRFSDDQRGKQSGYKTGRVAGLVLAGAGVAVLAVSATKKGS